MSSTRCRLFLADRLTRVSRYSEVGSGKALGRVVAGLDCPHGVGGGHDGGEREGDEELHHFGCVTWSRNRKKADHGRISREAKRPLQDKAGRPPHVFASKTCFARRRRRVRPGARAGAKRRWPARRGCVARVYKLRANGRRARKNIYTAFHCFECEVLLDIAARGGARESHSG